MTSKARNLADVISGNFDIPLSALDNVPPSNNASALTTGTLPVARIADGSLAAAKLASGAAVGNLGFTPFNAASAGALATRGGLVRVVDAMHLTGNWSANVWHQVPDISFSVLGSGIYILSAWVDTHTAGGDSYAMRYSSMVPIGQEFTNSNHTNDLVLQRGGHAPNASQFFMRTRLTGGAVDGNMRLDFQTNQAWSNIAVGIAGRNVFFEVWRVT